MQVEIEETERSIINLKLRVNSVKLEGLQYNLDECKKAFEEKIKNKLNKLKKIQWKKKSTNKKNWNDYNISQMRRCRSCLKKFQAIGRDFFDSSTVNQRGNVSSSMKLIFY